jgi:hypothetical protein
MSCSVTYDAADGFLAVRMAGRFDATAVRDLVSAIAAAAREHDGHRILNDARDAIPDASTLDIYDLPRLISELLGAAGLARPPLLAGDHRLHRGGRFHVLRERVPQPLSARAAVP